MFLLKLMKAMKNRFDKYVPRLCHGDFKILILFLILTIPCIFCDAALFGLVEYFGEYRLGGKEINKIHQFLVNGTSDSKIFENTLTILSSLSGIAIPISISIVSENLRDYKDSSVSLMFTNEKEFSFQVYSFLVLLSCNLVFQLFNFFSLITTFYILICSFYYLYRFFNFILLIIAYTTDTEEFIKNNSEETIMKFLS